jgi:hypothetical protein
VERVPSEENIADLPSRESYEALEELEAEWVPPTIAGIFMDRYSVVPGGKR